MIHPRWEDGWKIKPSLVAVSVCSHPSPSHHSQVENIERARARSMLCVCVQVLRRILVCIWLGWRLWKPTPLLGKFNLPPTSQRKVQSGKDASFLSPLYRWLSIIRWAPYLASSLAREIHRRIEESTPASLGKAKIAFLLSDRGLARNTSHRLLWIHTFGRVKSQTVTLVRSA